VLGLQLSPAHAASPPALLHLHSCSFTFRWAGQGGVLDPHRRGQCWDFSSAEKALEMQVLEAATTDAVSGRGHAHLGFPMLIGSLVLGSRDGLGGGSACLSMVCAD